MAESLDKELEEQLLEAGNRLLHPPSSVDELLPLLDQVENCLSRVVQSPSESMHNALLPSQKALIANELLRHSDIDVKVSVASCISEITRISAPEAPYDDDQMKEVFQLIVSSFENLSDKSSRSYNKRTSILETVAKVRSCVVMLDLECDALIIEMFQHFLKSIRDYHPETVFTLMETIMILVLEESEDISVELLTPILASLKKDSEEFLPIARKLGERVFENCASKLKPYLRTAVKALGIFLDDYSKVVASICLEKSGSVEQGDGNVSGVNQVVENVTEVASHEEVDATRDKSLKPVVAADGGCLKTVISNGVILKKDGGSSLDSDTLKKLNSQSKNINASNKCELDEVLDIKKMNDLEAKKEQTLKRRGRKPNSVMNSTEPSDSSHNKGDKESEKLPDLRKSRRKKARNLRFEDSSVDVTPPNEKEMALQVSSPKASDSEAATVVSPTGSGSVLDKTRSGKGGRPRKRETISQEAKPSADVSTKTSEGTSDTEVKPHRRSIKKVTAVIAEGKTPPADTLKKEIKLNSSEAKPLKLSTKKVDYSNKSGDGSFRGLQQGRERRRRGKAPLEKDGLKSSAEDDVEEMTTSRKSAIKFAKGEPIMEETPKLNSKRKRTPAKEVPEISKFGKNLVGSKIKVWWPDDKMYYDGVIHSFDPVKKKHKVSYTDGDVEVLNLKNEEWEFIEEKSVPAGEEADCPSPDATSEMHQKKKPKAKSNLSVKQTGIVSSSKRGGRASASNSKVSSARAGRKSRDVDKLDGRPKDVATKSIDKSEGTSSAKSKNRTAKGGSKSVQDTPKTASKSMDVDTDTPKTSGKSKQETPKSSTKSKGKTSKSGSKSNVNGKMKSGSSKVKESEDSNERPLVSGKALGSGKGKSPDSLKGQNSEVKTGKKRQMG